MSDLGQVVYLFYVSFLMCEIENNNSGRMD